MGSLSNLYISQSYQSLIHLGNDTSASATQIELQDGIGQGLGIFVNTNGDVSIDGALIVSGTFDIEGRIIVNDDVRINGNLAVSGATSLTGSLNVTQNITASNIFVSTDLNVGGTLFASKVVTLIESSSIIYSSGSNILGDEVSDIQTLIGSVIMSGSASLTGSMGISGDLEVKGNISSSTISGIGNVTSYSQSVDARLDIVEATASLYVPFSQSVDARLDIVEATASLYVPFSTSVDSRLDELENFSSSTYNTFSQSVDSRLDFLEGPFSSSISQEIITLQLFTASVGLVTTASFQAFTASTNQRLNSLEFATSSLQSFTSSTNSRLSNIESTTASLLIETANLETFSASTLTRLTNIESTTASLLIETANLELFSASTLTRLNGLSSVTASYATTGSNSFNGNQTITGSLILSSSAAIELSVIGNSTFSGSVRGVVLPISISSNTASMDCSLGNFFTLTLNAAATTRLVATNIQPGETITLKILQPATTGSLTYPSYIKFPNLLAYSASAISGATDIITFVTYDSTNLFAAATKNLR